MSPSLLPPQWRGAVAGVDNTPSATLEGVGLTIAYYVGSTATGTPLGSA